jgi:hypothetical protein
MKVIKEVKLKLIVRSYFGAFTAGIEVPRASAPPLFVAVAGGSTEKMAEEAALEVFRPPDRKGRWS